MLEIKDLTVRYGSYLAVDHLSLSVGEGQWLMIVGPNGAGKSTVLNAVTQGIPYTGTVLLMGEDVKKMRASHRARKIGILAQNHMVGYEFTVEEIVRLGRYAYSSGMLAGRNKDDESAVEEALALTGMTQLRNQTVLTLSGGELQRTFLAQVFAQDPRLLLLDEPTNHLDLLYQKQVFELVAGWVKKPGRAVVSVVHDLSLAKLFGSDALLMYEGKAVSAGPAGHVISPENLFGTYHMDVYAWMRRLLGQWQEELPRAAGDSALL